MAGQIIPPGINPNDILIWNGARWISVTPTMLVNPLDSDINLTSTPVAGSATVRRIQIQNKTVDPGDSLYLVAGSTTDDANGGDVLIQGGDCAVGAGGGSIILACGDNIDSPGSWGNILIGGNGAAQTAQVVSFGPTGTQMLFSPGDGSLQLVGMITKYRNATLTRRGIAYQMATVDLNNQSAAIGVTTMLTSGAAEGGLFRISYSATVTQAATTSSTLGGAAGFQIQYTDNDDSVVKTMPGTVVAGVNTNATNSTGTGTISGCFVANVKASTAIQYLMGYTSSGATVMQYNLHISVEAL